MYFCKKVKTELKNHRSYVTDYATSGIQKSAVKLLSLHSFSQIL